MNVHDKIKQLKADHGLTWPQIAEMLGVSAHTVNSWSQNPTHKSARSPGPCCVELLELKLGLRRQSNYADNADNAPNYADNANYADNQ